MDGLGKEHVWKELGGLGRRWIWEELFGKGVDLGELREGMNMIKTRFIKFSKNKKVLSKIQDSFRLIKISSIM